MFKFFLGDDLISPKVHWFQLPIHFSWESDFCVRRRI